MYLIRNSKNLFHGSFIKNRKFCLKLTKELDFNDFIKYRKDQAKQSIVVQVQSENSFGDLYKYCSQYGDIIGAHHYRIKKGNSNFIIVEYKKSDSISEIIKSASYNLDVSGIPVCSPLFWFKATNSKQSSTKPLENCSKLLTISDGLSQLKENAILELILSVENVNEQIKLLYESTKLNDLEIRLRFLAAKQVEDSLSGLFPNANALPFGSSVNGFGKMGCDLDLVLRFDKEYTKRNNESRLIFHTKENLTNERSQIQKQMESLSDILQIFFPGVSNVRRILQARVPIIKFHHLILNLDVDLTMNNLSGVYMSELLYLCGKLDERVWPLIFVVRKWAQSVGLTNPSPGRWITNFSLSCLVIFFLQQLKTPILPSLNVLIRSTATNDLHITDNAIDCNFVKKSDTLNFKTDNNKKLNELLLQFFEFYAQFDFGNKALSLNQGLSIIKPDSSPLYIVNPLEQTVNISKNISLEECERLRIEVRNAAWILENETDNSGENSSNSWGIANLFRNSQVTLVKPNIFFKPRMVEIKELFDDRIDTKNSNNTKDENNIKNIKILNTSAVKNIKINEENDR